MATYVNDLRLKEIATGDESGTWGDSTNINLELIADAFSYATKDCFATDADATETMADGLADEIRSLYLKVTSSATLTATRTLTLAPNDVSKIWIIENATTGGQSISISQGSGANVTIPNGDVKVIYTDGAGAGAAVTDAFANLNVGALTATTVNDIASKAFGTDSIMIGDTTTGTISAADYNVGLGVDVFAALTSGDENIAIGTNALDALTTGIRNTAIGRNALTTAVDDDFNTAVGAYALNTNEADDNVAVGYLSMYANTTGTANTAIGTQSLDANSTASNGTAVGYRALTSSTTGASNTAVGKDALLTSTTASGNTAVGAFCMDANTTGNESAAFGYGALGAHTTGNSNVGLGYLSGENLTDGGNNTFAGRSSGATYTTGTRGVAIGSFAAGGTGSKTGDSNICIGYIAGANLTSGHSNVFIGDTAGNDATDAHSNVAIGYLAAASLVTVSPYQTRNNVAIGREALENQVTQEDNIAIGYQALGTGNSPTNSQIVAIGTRAANGAHAAYGGTYVGYEAGTSITSGVHNTLFGREAGRNITTGTLNICLGYNAVPSGAGTSEIVIGNSVSGRGNNTGYIYPPGGGAMYQANNLTTWAQVSDRRIKKNIVDNNDGLNKINAIRVRNFEYRTEEEITDFENIKAVVVKKEGLQLGVIAQEIQEILPDVVTEESTGSLTVTPDNLIWYLVNAVQELSAQVEELKGN